MPQIKSKSEILALLELPVFTQLIGMQTPKQLTSIPRIDLIGYGEYGEESSGDAPAGVMLFSLPSKNRGESTTTVHVAKLFGATDKPFRVFGTEWVPWGTDMDPSLTFADVETLGEALDSAFLIHEKGHFEINRLSEDEETGHYVRAEAISELPAAVPASSPELGRNLKIQAAMSTSVEAWKVFDLEATTRDPVRIEDVAAIMRIAHASGVDFTTNPGESCLAMNEVLFKNEGEVLAGVNEFFVLEELFIGKFAVRIDEPVTGDEFLIDLNGQFMTMDQLLGCGVLKADVAQGIIKTMKLDVVPTENDLTTPTIIDFAGLNKPLLFNPVENALANKVATLTQAVAEFSAKHVVHKPTQAPDPVARKGRKDEEDGLSM
jgi:hypothetical protein